MAKNYTKAKFQLKYIAVAAMLTAILTAGSHFYPAWIHIGQEPSSPEKTIEKFQQALIRRDEDFAKSLLNYEQNYPLTVSNPHPSGYRILSSHSVNGRAYVDAELFLQYTANPYYQIVKSRYELTDSRTGHRINKISNIGMIEVSEQDGTIYMNNNGHQKELLQLQDVPVKYLGNNRPYRLSSLVFLEESNSLIAAVHHLNREGKSTAISLLSFDIENADFSLLDRMEIDKGTLAVSGLSADPENRYLSVDILTEIGNQVKGSVNVYDLKKKRKIVLKTLLEEKATDSICSLFWTDDGFMFEVSANSQTETWLYHPDEKYKVRKAAGFISP